MQACRKSQYEWLEIMNAHWTPMFVLPNIPREVAIGCDIVALGHSQVYRTRNEARADIFDYIERFYNPRRRHSKLGDISLMEFEARAVLA